MPLDFVHPSAAFASTMTSVRVFASLGFFAVFLHSERTDVDTTLLGFGDGHVTSYFATVSSSSIFRNSVTATASSSSLLLDISSSRTRMSSGAARRNAISVNATGE